jgi:hypothetical protein
MKKIVTSHISRAAGLLFLGAGLALPMSAQAQPDLNNAAKARNPPNRARRAKGQKGQRAQRNIEKQQARAQERELATAEAIAGKPLTEEQKQKVRDAVNAREEVLRTAREKYVTDLAASLDMEPDAVRLKMRGTKGNRNGAAGTRQGRRNRDAITPVPGA